MARYRREEAKNGFATIPAVFYVFFHINVLVRSNIFSLLTVCPSSINFYCSTPRISKKTMNINFGRFWLIFGPDAC